jgi:hypothetical protein
MNVTELMALSEKVTQEEIWYYAPYIRESEFDVRTEGQRFVTAAVNFIRSPEFAERVKNAARYRWLQEHGLEICWNRMVPYSPGYTATDAEEMDIAIDAHLAAQQGEGK